MGTDQVLARLPGCNFRNFVPDGRSFITCEVGDTLSVRDFPIPAGLAPERPR